MSVGDSSAKCQDRRADPHLWQNGVVDLKQDFDQDLSRFAGPHGDALAMADIGLHAMSIVASNTIIVGAAGREGTTPGFVAF
jgi:quinoprotein glucose dehydrogenase